MLSAVEAEVLDQPSALKSYLGHRLDRAPQGSVFVGAGDSFVASSIANYLSSMRYIILDPYELVSRPALAKGRSVYFVSVSGRTASNLAASKAVVGIASRRVVVTANPKGALAKATDSTVSLPYEVVPRIPGTLSFTLTLAALLKMSNGDFRCDFEKLVPRAKEGARRVAFAQHGVSHFLGNSAAFPVCQYAVLKTFEIIGRAAQATMLEEFSHSAVFGLRRNDAVNIFSLFDPARLGARLSALLEKSCHRPRLISAFGSNDYEVVFYSIFLVQFAVLREARGMGLSVPRFLSAKEKLALSDAMIY